MSNVNGSALFIIDVAAQADAEGTATGAANFTIDVTFEINANVNGAANFTSGVTMTAFGTNIEFPYKLVSIRKRKIEV